METKFDTTIDYSQKQAENSSYSFSKIVPLSGVQTVTPGQDVQYELPPIAMNLARSYFSGSLTVPAQTAIAPATTAHSWLHRGIVPFSAVSLYTRQGQYLCDLRQDATRYTRVVNSADATAQELESGDESGVLYTANDSKSYLGGKAGNGSTAKGYQQQAYVTASADLAAQTWNFKIPFSAIKRTIFALDRSILFNQVLVLKIKMADTGDLAYHSDSATNPDSNAANLNVTAGFQITNSCLFICTERNSEIVQSLVTATRTNEGMTFLCEYPTTFSQTRSTTQQNISIRLNRSFGASLLSVKNCVFGNGANNLKYDRDTSASSKVVSYYTDINGNRLLDFNPVVADQEPWMIHKDRLSNTPALNRTIYEENWFHEDRFDNGVRQYRDGEVDDSTYAGVSLDDEIRYNISYTTANATHSHYTIAHCIKVLNINASGLVIS